MNTQHKLSNQAVGSIMLALQNAILEQNDITQTLKDFILIDSVDGLIVENPPSVKFEDKEEETPIA